MPRTLSRARHYHVHSTRAQRANPQMVPRPWNFFASAALALALVRAEAKP
jgi:hypothetical protein